MMKKKNKGGAFFFKKKLKLMKSILPNIVTSSKVIAFLPTKLPSFFCNASRFESCGTSEQRIFSEVEVFAQRVPNIVQMKRLTRRTVVSWGFLNFKFSRNVKVI